MTARFIRKGADLIVLELSVSNYAEMYQHVDCTHCAWIVEADDCFLYLLLFCFILRLNTIEI